MTLTIDAPAPDRLARDRADVGSTSVFEFDATVRVAITLSVTFVGRQEHLISAIPDRLRAA